MPVPIVMGISLGTATHQTEVLTGRGTPKATGMIGTETSATVTIRGTGPLVTLIRVVVGTMVATRLFG